MIRGSWIELGDETRHADGTGASLDCPLGLSACWQYMANLRPRHGHTIRFQIDGFAQDTPSAINIQFRASYPGDWIVLAIPYPASAYPFNVSSYL